MTQFQVKLQCTGTFLDLEGLKESGEGEVTCNLVAIREEVILVTCARNLDFEGMLCL